MVAVALDRDSPSAFVVSLAFIVDIIEVNITLNRFVGIRWLLRCGFS